VDEKVRPSDHEVITMASGASAEATIHHFPRRPRAHATHVRPVLRAAYRLSTAVVALMVAVSILGLVVHGLYRDGAWAREAFRGGDLVTLAIAAPLLALSLALAPRGSARGTAVWIGMLGYSVYNYAFYVFGPNFNDIFLLHILVFALSVFALACGLATLDIRTIGERLRLERWARWLGALLVAVGLGQGALWIFLAIRYAVTGELLEDVPVGGQHLVFALDLSLMMPALVIAGVLLFRRTAAGFLLGTATSVLGAVYTLNGLAAAWFQARADVPGTEAFSPDAIVLTAAMAVPAIVLLAGRRRAAGSDMEASAA
jgi:hypothetical protein